MNQNLYVHLRVYRGPELRYDKNGNPTTENQIVKLQHNTQEYHRFLSMFRANGYCGVEVVRIYDAASKKEVSDSDIVDPIKEEVDKAFNDGLQPEMTAEQKRIADLEATVQQMKEMLAKGNAPAEETETHADLEAARKEYMEITGQQGDKRWTAETINKKIAELKASE